ncbi:MAG: hypothetical protein HY698_07340 [Deltaproteobacteria bacterium]|nr:hypothetical protein [Deltaproteobacteria bacterium]
MKKALLAAVLLGTSLWTAGVGATDDKVYPGAGCVKEGTTGTPLVDDRGRIWNASLTEWLWVECPIVRDDTGGVVDDADLYAYDLHYSNNITCTLYGWNREGSGVNGISTRSTSGSNSGGQALDFDALNWAGSDWYNVIRCGIPPMYSGNRSGISSYKIAE